MRQTKWIITLAIFFIALAQGFSQENAKVVYVVEEGQKPKLAKYLYGDLKKGLNKVGEENVTIDFVTIDKADASLFENYGAVIVVNEGNADTLNPAFKEFVEANKDVSNMIVVAFVPAKTEFKNQEVVDVVSSASPKAFSKKFVRETLAIKVGKVLIAQQ